MDKAAAGRREAEGKKLISGTDGHGREELVEDRLRRNQAPPQYSPANQRCWSQSAFLPT